MKNFLLTAPYLLISIKSFAGGGGSGSSWQDQFLFLIPLLILILLWLAPKIYSSLKTKFRKQAAEEGERE
jgi:hypothetical protein